MARKMSWWWYCSIFVTHLLPQDKAELPSAKIIDLRPTLTIAVIRTRRNQEKVESVKEMMESEIEDENCEECDFGERTVILVAVGL